MAKSKYDNFLEYDGLLLVEGYARDGLTDEQIMKNINISKQTFYNWVAKHVDFSNALKRGRKPVATIVENTFFNEKLKSQFVEEETVEMTEQRNAKGELIGTTKHIKKNKRYIPADTTAIIFYLKCRLNNRYNDRPIQTEDTAALDKLDSILTEIKSTAANKATTKAESGVEE